VTSWVICSALLNKCDEEKKSQLVHFLSSEEKHLIETSSPPYRDPLVEPQAIDKILSRIHPSWFSPFLRQHSESEIRIILSAFEEEKAKQIAKLLRFSFHRLSLNPIAIQYFQRWAWEKITEGKSELLPISCLPASSLNIILELDHDTLTEVIDYLGLYDLAIEIKHIIDTVKLKHIYSALSKEQLNFLKTLVHQKESISFRMMGLNQWDGNVAHLKSLLHQRGINRLAKVLFNEQPDLFWYVSHILDMERATLLSKLCTSLNQPRAIKILAGQVIETINHVQTVIKKENPISR
jgi:hypothetical protein